MFRAICIAAFAVLTSSPVTAHEIRYGKTAVGNPYEPYAFLIGDWDVTEATGGKPFVRVKFHWAANHAYIQYGAYIGDAPHFEGMMMWNGIHHNLDVLLATDMERGLVQEQGTAKVESGAFVQVALATYSEGVGAGGAIAGVGGLTQRTRETMRPIDSNHIAVSYEVETSGKWKPMMPGADHLLMSRVGA